MFRNSKVAIKDSKENSVVYCVKCGTEIKADNRCAFSIFHILQDIVTHVQ